MLSNRKLATLTLSFLLLAPSTLLAENNNTAQPKGRTITVQPRPEASRPGDNADLVKFSEYPAASDDIEAAEGVDDIASSEFIHAYDTTIVGEYDRPALASTARKLKEASDPHAYDDMLKALTLTDQDYKGPVEKNINLFSVGIRKHFVRYLERSGRYMGMMQGILRENYLPEDLVFLALIESGFNPKAYSWAKASGPWQFISGTAKKYGLRIDTWVDERRDPVKSTRAAAAYLKDLYNMFGSWSLAMASYNAGEGRVSRAVKKNGSPDYWELRQSRYIASETKEYVPKFMAAKIIAENPAAYGFDDIQYERPFEFDEVEVTSPTPLAAAAECCGTTLQEMKDLNPELKRSCTPPNARSYTLRVPKGTAEKFKANYAKIPESKKTVTSEYTVRRGDTLSRIAARHGVSVSELASMNRISDRSHLAVGQTLTLSVPVGDATKYLADTSDDEGPAASYYKVRRGDTLSKIASRHGTTTAKLARLNGISARSDIKVGQRLKVSGSATKAAKSSTSSRSSGKSYRVKSGDTLWNISQRFGVSMDALLNANSLSKRSVLKSGQRLVIPSGAGAA